MASVAGTTATIVFIQGGGEGAHDEDAAIPGSVTRTTMGGHQLGNGLRMVADDIREIVSRA